MTKTFKTAVKPGEKLRSLLCSADFFVSTGKLSKLSKLIVYDNGEELKKKLRNMTNLSFLGVFSSVLGSIPFGLKTLWVLKFDIPLELYSHIRRMTSIEVLVIPTLSLELKKTIDCLPNLDVLVLTHQRKKIEMFDGTERYTCYTGWPKRKYFKGKTYEKDLFSNAYRRYFDWYYTS